MTSNFKAPSLAFLRTRRKSSPSKQSLSGGGGAKSPLLSLASLPLVSAVMPTNRAHFVQLAINVFFAQTYPNKELVIVRQGDFPIQEEEGIRVINAPVGTPLGTLRHMGDDAAKGEIIVRWDDDDYYSPDRITLQVEPMLLDPTIKATALKSRVHASIVSGKAIVFNPSRAIGSTLVYRKLPDLKYCDILRKREDYTFMRANFPSVHLVSAPHETTVRVHHGDNIWSEDVIIKSAPTSQPVTPILRRSINVILQVYNEAAKNRDLESEKEVAHEEPKEHVESAPTLPGPVVTPAHPLLSVVISVRNRVGPAIACFASLAAQTFEGFEVIVSDYGSTAQQSSRLKSLCETFGFIYAFTETDSIWCRSAALNKGIRLARGKYVVTTDIDMIFHPSMMEKLIEEQVAHDGKAVINCRTYMMERGIYPSTWEAASKVQKKRLHSMRGLGACQCAPLESMVLLGLFDESFKEWGGEDRDFNGRLIGSGLTQVWLDEQYAMHHIWHRGDRRKPIKRYQKEGTVLLTPDVPNWAFDRIAMKVRSYLADEGIEAFVEYDKDTKKPTNSNAVVVFWWPSSLKYVARTKVVLLFDHFSADRDPVLAARILGSADAVGFASEHLAKKYKHLCSRYFLCEDGVDSSFFYKQPPTNNVDLVVGWAGNSKLSIGQKDLKGIELIKEAVLSVPGARLVLADRAEKWRTMEEMREWYKGIDVYCCASIAEGTPNPILESASCGKAAISTDVGIVSHLNRDGARVKIVDRSVQAIADAVHFYVHNREHLRVDGDCNRLAIETSWDWKSKVTQYTSILKELVP